MEQLTKGAEGTTLRTTAATAMCLMLAGDIMTYPGLQ